MATSNKNIPLVVALREYKNEHEMSPDNQLEDNDIVLLWIYRLIVPLGGYKSFLREKDFRDDTLADVLGFKKYLRGESSKKFQFNDIRNQLVKNWEAAEQNKLQFQYKDLALKDNVASLCRIVGLNKTEQAILHFTVSVSAIHLLELATSYLGTQNAKSLERLYSICLEENAADVRAALNPNGLLSMSGLLSLDSTLSFDFSLKVELLKGLVDGLHMHHDNPEEILSSIIELSPKPKLTQEDYPHLAKDISIIKDYLRQASEVKRRGVNILLYGVPGSGKTEFARMACALSGLSLYEIASGSKKATPMDSKERFRAFRLGQMLCERQNASCILFDEVEDVFKGQDNQASKPICNKAWVNHVLEHNPVPAFWITNNIHVMDPAYIRRFDYVLQLNSPPRSVRERVLTHYLVSLPVSSQWKKQIAENPAIVPAIVERSVNVIKVSGHVVEQSKTESYLHAMLSNTVEAMGYARPSFNKSGDALDYRLDVLNTNYSVESICEGLKQHHEARICLYGPSGTGKTAFGKHIAEILDLPLLSKRASDIVSPFIGMTERNMADMFIEAKEENAVLMLDEADSFLSNRQQAQRQWEVSAVNEMLTQLEAFDGIFIASTNFMETIDSAAMRRFDIKLKFDYMKPQQVLTMFESLAGQYDINLDSFTRNRLAKLNLLTPGDFAAVRRKLRLIKANSADALVSMLEDECHAKPNGLKKAIGF